MFIYSNQKCNVRWGNAFSNTFNVQNGVRQGAVSSPVLFCIYIDKIIKLLRCSTIGCQIQGVYMGIWVYADDIILLSPSRTGLQEMVKRKWVFVTNSIFFCLHTLQPDVVDIWYFKIFINKIVLVWNIKGLRY